MSLRIAFLGTGTCSASSRNPCSLAVTDGEDLICVDFGGGAYHQIARLGSPFFNYKNISAIFLTHFHVDHVSGLPDFFWGEMWDSTGRRERPLTLAGPRGLKNFHEKRLLPFLGDYQVPFDVNLVEMDSGEEFSGSFYRMTSCPLAHGECSTGFLLSAGGHKLGITGDTGYCENLALLLKSSDTAVMEWSIPDSSQVPGHITGKDMVALLDMGVMPRRVYITHVYPRPGLTFEEVLDRCREAVAPYATEFIFARDGDMVELVKPQ